MKPASMKDRISNVEYMVFNLEVGNVAKNYM